MEEKIKTAEEEKEALKQKIAQLEVAAKQGPPSSNGSNEVNKVWGVSNGLCEHASTAFFFASTSIDKS